MVDSELDISILEQEIRYGNQSQPLHMQNYFLIHKWTPDDMSFSLYTDAELQKLHRSFGHPSVRALIGLLRRARPDEVTPRVKSALEDIVKSCTTCPMYASKPRCFKLN